MILGVGSVNIANVIWGKQSAWSQTARTGEASSVCKTHGSFLPITHPRKNRIILLSSTYFSFTESSEST